jgi:hypothetical protein
LDDRSRVLREQVIEARVRRLEWHLDGQVVDGREIVEADAPDARHVLGIAHRLKAVDDVGGGEALSVVPGHVGAQLYFPDRGVGVRDPLECESRLNREVRGHAHEAVVDVVQARVTDVRPFASRVERLVLPSSDIRDSQAAAVRGLPLVDCAGRYRLRGLVTRASG